ncbi:hypothetical protein [Flavobacterium sp. K5-23]|uniref:hypothetical protein n=1 Tax=Flavobacterium sp. K5-23 TaxID=2746225 RepID=UPI00200BCBD0|nr:hypothetical protein [Flavobacterium sp. K5-23]UQD55257.1 hypothetical protein FLAK523_02160 [Flavobacterium sp. K5-23]
MKKLVFTAVAVVAFSGVTMASVRATDNAKKIIMKKVFVITDCNAAKFVAYVDARAAGFSKEDASRMSYSVYFMCMGLTKE